MAWYRSGTISLTNGSAAVTGAGTAWILNASVGEALLAPDGKLYEISAIASDTSITLATAYLGATQAGQAYVLVPTQSYIRDLAAQAAALVNAYSSIANNAGAGKFGDGTVAAPGVTFAGDQDTGFFRSANNEVTFVANGVAQFKYSATGGVQFLSTSVLAAAGTPVYLGNTEDASVAEISSPSPSVVKVKTTGVDTLTVSALTGNTSHTAWTVDTVAGANYELFRQGGVNKAITGSEASIFGASPNNYGTHLYESGAEYFVAVNGGKLFRVTGSGLWGYGDFSLGQAGARVAYLPGDSLTYEGRTYANYGMSVHPELVGLSGFNGVGLFAAGGLRSEVTSKGLKVYGSTNVVGGGSKIQRTIYGICSCDLSPNEKVNGFKLKTTVPYSDDTFLTIRLHGYDYRAATPIDLTVSLYNYSLGVIQAGASSAGGWVPVIRAANEGGSLVLHFGLQVSDGYYAHFDVDATFFEMPADDPRTEGWTFVDEPLTGTGQVTIPCVNRMADLHLTNSAFIAGKLNIASLPANDFPNDAAAAADGIPIGGLYHTAGTVKVRLS